MARTEGWSLEETSKEYTVSGLTELEFYDAFADITLEYSGVAPEATASLTVSGGRLDESCYTLSKTKNIAFGDVITVTIDPFAVETLSLEQGLYPEEMSRDYIVEDVAHYVTALDEIPDDAMEKMKDQAMDHMNAYFANNWDSDYGKLTSLDFIGNYLLVPKETSSNTGNRIFLVFKVSTELFGKNENGGAVIDTFEYFWYCLFQEGVLLPDGTFSIDYSNYAYPSENNSSGNEYRILLYVYDYTYQNASSQKNTLMCYGAEDLDSLFNRVVTANIEDYTYESTVSEPTNEDADGEG